MIKFLPEIYPDEIVFSYLSRCYARSGYIWNMGFEKEIFNNPNANIDRVFHNVFSEEFKSLIEEKIGLKNLLVDHTLFKYYARFLPLEKRKTALQAALRNESHIGRHLPTPKDSPNSCLRYCPMCVKEDRLSYGEAYMHATHAIPSITVCHKHCCELVDIDFINNRAHNTTFIHLEHVYKDIQTCTLDQNDINVKISCYIAEVFEQPLNMEKDLLIGNFLTNKLKEEYVSPRGEHRNLERLLEDLSKFYIGSTNLTITKRKLAVIYRNLSHNPYEILLVAMFQNITPWELCSYAGSSEPRHLAFDKTVRELYQNGLTKHKIARILQVNHEVIRQVLMGTYDKPHHPCSTYKCQRWNWEKIDDECCKNFHNKVKGLKRRQISRPTVAKLFGLRDKTLRNLPRLRGLIKDYQDKVQ